MLNPLALALKSVWRLVPGQFRLYTYLGLGHIGRCVYGSTNSLNVQKLPFGLYLKQLGLERHQALANEHAALELVRTCSGIPVPSPLDFLSSSKKSYLVTSTVPGQSLGHVIDRLTEADFEVLLRGLEGFVRELRTIPRPAQEVGAISNVTGHGCYDHRINAGLSSDENGGDFTGPFADEDEFNRLLASQNSIDAVQSKKHRILWTHGDLNMRNILVNDGRISGIVDWGNSGWYPEHWEYTKAHFAARRNRRWLRAVDIVFGKFGDYSEELTIERRLWEYCF